MQLIGHTFLSMVWPRVENVNKEFLVDKHRNEGKDCLWKVGHGSMKLGLFRLQKKCTVNINNTFLVYRYIWHHIPYIS